MVLASPHHCSNSDSNSNSNSPKRLTVGFLMSVSSLMALCAKHANRVSSKLKTSNNNSNKRLGDHLNINLKSPRRHSSSPRSPLARPKQLMTQISNKAITFINHRKLRADREKDDGDVLSDPDEEFGDGGVWRKTILMGDKCQPLDFSGVIYYDSNGKQLNEVPLRSPRASPLPGYLTRAT